MRPLACDRMLRSAAAEKSGVHRSHCRQRCRRAAVSAMAATGSGAPTLLINSTLGKMGQAVAQAASAAGLTVLPYTLCPAGEAAKRGGSIDVAGQQMQLVEPAQRDALLEELKAAHPSLIVVDYTVPDVIHDMVSLYVKHMTPFVMGTTGGDRARLLAEVQAAGLYAVIAPQMGKQVVAFQATMEMMASQFPGAFAGYTLRVVESHQSSKKDTSGTAKAIVASFQGLGLAFDVSQIELVRDAEQQVQRMGVPQEHLLGHAYHTYQLVSPDGTVSFEFQHNVCGRSIYAEGTVDAALFLHRQIGAGAEQKLYTMVDVLRAGAMR